MPIAKSARKPNAALMKPVQPDDTLAKIVGSTPLPRSEVTEKVLRVTAPRHGGWAVQDHRCRRLSNPEDMKPHDDNAAGHHPGAGEPIEPQGQKCQRRGQVAEHRDPVIGRAVDHPIQGASRISSLGKIPFL